MEEISDASSATPARTFTALRISTDKKLELIPINADSPLSDLQAGVGGYIEFLDLAPGLLMVLDEEGKLKPRPLNDIAIRLTQHYAVPLKVGDLIVGDVLLVGTADSPEGRCETEVPDSAIQLLARLGYPLS